MPTYIALLHSIVLGPGRRVVMADLRAMAEGLGFRGVRTVVATGNLVFEAEAAPVAELEGRLEVGFAGRFGRHVDIILREGRAWRRLADGNPFAEESAADGSRVIVRVGREALGEEVCGMLAPCLDGGERVALVEGDLWAHFPGQASQSRLLGALTPKKLGGAGTLRNWNTVRRLAEMVG